MVGQVWVVLGSCGKRGNVTLKPTKLFEFATGSFKMAPALRPALMLLVSGCAAFIAAPAAPLCRARARARVAPPRVRAPLPRIATRVSGAADDDMALLREDAEAIFTVIDFNGDDKIEYAELHAHLHGACGYPDEAVEDIMALLDANDDAIITRAELSDAFAQFLSVRFAEGMGGDGVDAFGDGGDISDGGLHADADALFARLDVDGDGEISLDELRAHLKTRGYADVAVDKIFARLDANLDGALSREELRAAFLRYSALRYATGARAPDE